jgi:hypothetical protein
MVLIPKYRETDDYRASLCIPSIVMGGALEGRICRESKEVCPDRKAREIALTTFVDFKIAKTLRFRVGFPIKRVTVAGVAVTELATVTSFSLQLSQPK